MDTKIEFKPINDNYLDISKNNFYEKEKYLFDKLNTRKNFCRKTNLSNLNPYSRIALTQNTLTSLTNCTKTDYFNLNTTNFNNNTRLSTNSNYITNTIPNNDMKTITNDYIRNNNNTSYKIFNTFSFKNRKNIKKIIKLPNKEDLDIFKNIKLENVDRSLYKTINNGKLFLLNENQIKKIKYFNELTVIKDMAYFREKAKILNNLRDRNKKTSRDIIKQYLSLKKNEYYNKIINNEMNMEDIKLMRRVNRTKNENKLYLKKMANESNNLNIRAIRDNRETQKIIKGIEDFISVRKNKKHITIKKLHTTKIISNSYNKTNTLRYNNNENNNVNDNGNNLLQRKKYSLEYSRIT